MNFLVIEIVTLLQSSHKEKRAYYPSNHAKDIALPYENCRICGAQISRCLGALGWTNIRIQRISSSFLPCLNRYELCLAACEVGRWVVLFGIEK